MFPVAHIEYPPEFHVVVRPKLKVSFYLKGSNVAFCTLFAAKSVGCMVARCSKRRLAHTFGASRCQGLKPAGVTLDTPGSLSYFMPTCLALTAHMAKSNAGS